MVLVYLVAHVDLRSNYRLFYIGGGIVGTDWIFLTDRLVLDLIKELL